MKLIPADVWKDDMKNFRVEAEKYFAGETKRMVFKGIAGRFGVCAQKGDEPKKAMLRLRMPGGHMTKDRMALIAQEIRKYGINKLKFTTCQNIQLHNLDLEPLCNIMEDVLAVDIVTHGAGGDFPRNVTASPLSGLDKNEYFNVLPYAEAAGKYALQFINAPKMPRKYKIGFSSSPRNENHATMRDLGFAARPDGKFDVYSAGGLGLNPMIGIKVAEAVEPKDILKYIRAMWVLFRTYGNYENRMKARSRYMQETLGSKENYVKAFQEKLAEVEGTDDFSFEIHEEPITKTGNSIFEHPRAIEQKQAGLYSVVWHPMGGCPDPEVFCQVSDALQDIEAGEIRIGLEETAYIVNLTAEEAQRFIDMTAEDSAKSTFEMACACIGSSICQQGVRDPQVVLKASIEAVREAGLPDGALPAIHISGCPGSCATPQLAVIGFRGAVKERQSAWLLTVDGCALQDKEKFGRDVGVIFETEVPKFLVELGQTVADSGMDFDQWHKANPEGIDEVAKAYI